ncbi:MAG: AMP-binding protein [Fulvimarina manganoxydans]|uniref:AMP-binding protein n=1 Tax=Fulvimarina manganoxydans TaxID=937218 RepID=UPI0023575134|nr:AMP-binding protein [Fulvimarina manganoxydans]MCK5931618.1 AMP-binding protein [Fulvimarina manganoxydans]
MNKPWLDRYPEGVPHELPPHEYHSLVDLLDKSFSSFADSPAFHLQGSVMRFRDLEHQSRVFAAYLQSVGLKKGDRISLMMPNVFAYPVAVAGALRAGLIVVNTNPLYTAGELKRQLTDSGAKAIVVLENMASTLAACRKETELEHVIVASVGDLMPTAKRFLVNFVLRYVKKMVPSYDLPGSISFHEALSYGEKASFRPVEMTLDDVAVLQYTGGTTGVAKGATLTHGNVVANVIQSEYWYKPALGQVESDEQPVFVCALPLYHIFGFTVGMMLAMRTGGANILIPNPRDIPALLKAIKGRRFHSFPAVNTLFTAIARHPKAKEIDWSSLLLSVGGGMAVQKKTAEMWEALTGRSICEGYGLSETTPVASCNPTDKVKYTGTIGLPIPGTDMAVLDEEGRALGVGEIGEIAIRGPQVMAGYWKKPDETAKVMTDDGFFRTGDIGRMDEEGFFSIVDRKKDMINVSGFNVYPNEIEDAVVAMPGVLEAAVIGVPNEDSGEAVKLFVVREDESVDEDAVKTWCREQLTGYKRPRIIEFRDELPKSPVGKVLRRELRD